MLSEDPTRRVLSVDEFTAAVNAATVAAYPARLGDQTVVDVVAAALATVGVLSPPPDPEPDTCTAQYADEQGDWQQCQLDPHHDDDGPNHDSGEWAWSDGHLEAFPPRYKPATA